MANRGKGRALGIVFGVLALIACTVWCAGTLMHRWAGDSVNVALAEGSPDEMRAALLSLDSDKLATKEGKQAVEIAAERMRDMSISELMEVMRSKGLSEEERRRLDTVGHAVFVNSANKNVDEYFEAPKERREQILDRHLDEWFELMAEKETYREAHEDDSDSQAAKKEWKRRDRQSAKDRMEGGDPDRMKRTMYYWGQLKNRAKARGLNMRPRRGDSGESKPRRGKRD